MLVHEILKHRDSSWIMKHPLEVYSEMFDCEMLKSKADTYYNCIKNMDNVCVITTNYTPICESVSCLEENKISYIHGSFRWFENPKELEILDVLDNNSDFSCSNYFPFIFLQSGVKPIISATQIREWSKAVRYLDECSKLIIVGYRANCDDNHLNSMIREYILKGKSVVYLDYDNSSEDSILRRFCISEKPKMFKHCCVNKNNAIHVFRSNLLSANP